MGRSWRTRSLCHPRDFTQRVVKGLSRTRSWLRAARSSWTLLLPQAEASLRVIEGGVTGHGADYIIIDDPTELKDCDNVKRLDRVVELFDGEILRGSTIPSTDAW